MPHDDWEQIHYQELPDWMKEGLKSDRRITKSNTRIFSGKPFNYKVQYTVTGDIVSVSYWRSAPATTPAPPMVKKPDLRVLVVAILILLAGAAVLFFNMVPLSFEVPFLPGPSLENTTDGSGNFSGPTQTESQVTVHPAPADTDYRTLPKTVLYSYYTDASRKSISLTTYGGFAEYLSGRRTSSTSDKEAVMERMDNPLQKPYLQPLVDTIKNRSPNPDGQAKIAISLVQHLPYNAKRAFQQPAEWYYPYETVYSNKGTAADKSLLLAYLLKELEYDTIVFDYSSSMAVGVKCSPDYDYFNTGYAFIDVTRPTIITYVPDTEYGGGGISPNPRIIHVNEGKRSLDVGSEYRDALQLKHLERIGGALNQTESLDMLRISRMYDLGYTT
jgi:hypothetical protein